jgi:hypothetical protein
VAFRSNSGIRSALRRARSRGEASCRRPSSPLRARGLTEHDRYSWNGWLTLFSASTVSVIVVVKLSHHCELEFNSRVECLAGTPIGG